MQTIISSTSDFIVGYKKTIPLLEQTVGNRPISIPVGTQPRGLCFDGTYIWVPNFGGTPGACTISKINAATNAVVATINTGGTRPFAIAFDGTHIWVSMFADSNIIKIDPITNTIVATIAVNAGPRGLAFDGTHMWVANHGDSSGGTTVQKINISTNAIDATVTVGTTPYGLTFDGANIWVANFGSNTYSKIRISDNTIQATVSAIGAVAPIGVVWDGTSIWGINYSGTPTTSTINKIRPSDGVVLATLTIGQNPEFGCFDGNYLYVPSNQRNAVHKIDVRRNIEINEIAVGAVPFGCAYDGTYVWVTNFADGTVSKIPATPTCKTTMYYLAIAREA